MLSSRLFWKLFCVYAVLSAGAAVCIVTILNHRQRAIVYNQVDRRLQDSAVTVLNLVDDPFAATRNQTLSDAINKIATQNSTRITLIADDGVVVDDSERNPATMENHGDRSEVRQARSDGVGSARRESPTLGIPMLYRAIRVGNERAPQGYIRVSVPLDSVEGEVSRIQHLVVIVSVVVSLLALAPMFLLLRRIIQPMSTLTAAANAIAAGELQQTVAASSRDELGTLAEAFNTMSRELSARMTDLNRTSQELHGSSRLLSTVFGSMVEGVIAVDNDERVLFANAAAKSVFDSGDGDVQGRPIWECVRNDAVQTVVRQALSGLQRSIECKLPRNESIVEIRATPLAGDPCPGVVLVIDDVTELRRLENIRRDFVSNVSHELKTPLTIIQTATETLLDGAVDEPEHATRFLSRIDEQGKRLHELIVDLLHLARIESGQQAFEITSVSVQAVVESLVDEFSALADSRQVTLEIDSTDGDQHVEADSESLRTILENLLTNAVKYTPAGGRVTVSWQRDQAHAVIAVRDSGVGISREHQARIFERFYRVDRARSREVGGTGLGLAIVKHLAQVFSAQVTVESELGKGSIFTLRIPRSTEESMLTNS